MARPLKTFGRKVRVTGVCPAGVGHERVLHPDPHYDLERLFRLAWQSYHQGPMYGASTSCDLLSGLMFRGSPSSYIWPGRGGLTKRDREVAATVIQWLGTNIGMCFLLEVFRQYRASHEAFPLAEEIRKAMSWTEFHPKPRLGPRPKRLRRAVTPCE